MHIVNLTTLTDTWDLLVDEGRLPARGIIPTEQYRDILISVLDRLDDELPEIIEAVLLEEVHAGGIDTESVYGEPIYPDDLGRVSTISKFKSREDDNAL